VARAIDRFRARWGRAPRRGELRRIKEQGRLRKVLVHRGDLDRAWQQAGARHGFDRTAAQALARRATPARDPEALERRIEARLTERSPTFTASELRAVALEQAVGELHPREALARVEGMVKERTVIELEAGHMTTLAQRAREQVIERRLCELARPGGREVGERARAEASARVAERIGASLSEEQARALELITGAERGALLVGPAGTGKGLVIDAAARAEQLRGNRTLGIAVSGSTAQRLGQDSPALAGRTLTLDALVARAEHGRLQLDERTTIYLDEGGMVDTARLNRLSALLQRTRSKLVLIGDQAQLPSIGAGGMFERLSKRLPHAELQTVRRTLDTGEQRAWADLRAGRSDRAMAHYRARGRLHVRATRERALESAVRTWAALAEAHGVEQVALISDASNQEIDRLNARAQHLRAERGELGERELDVPGVHYAIREGDRIAMIDQHHARGEARIENGSRGRVVGITQAGEALVEFDVSGQRRVLCGDDLASLRLGYAQHIYRAQGATVQRSVVVSGGWQVSKESAYVQASRAREGTDWFVARDELGTEGQDADRINRLAELMRRSERQQPSLAFQERGEDAFEQLLERGPPSPTRALLRRFLPTVARSHDTSLPDRDQGLQRSR
jgi:ATP-dependent exoDNAse (exonuclease V) alpha subunit